MKNWKTTLSGLAALLTGATLIVAGDYTTGVASVVSGIGLIFAKDSNAK